MNKIKILFFTLFLMMPLCVSAENYNQNSYYAAYIAGDSSACIGDTDVSENIYLRSSCAIRSAIFEITYSADLELISAEPIDFKFASINDVYSENQMKTAVIVTVSAETNISQTDNETCPICLNFKILETASVGDATIAISKITINSNDNTTHEITDIDPCFLKIMPCKIDSIQIQPRSFAIGYTEYQAIIEPEYATNKDVIWSVDDEAIATITQDGVLYPKQNGSVIISAKAVFDDVNATQRVSVKAYASAKSITSDIGIWNRDFDPYKSMYMVVTNPEADAIYFTPVYDRGIMQYDGKIMLSGMPFKVVLNNSEITTLKFLCTGVENVTDREYIINVIRTSDKIVLDEDPPVKEYGSYYFKFTLNNAPKNTVVYIATYSSEGSLLSVRSVNSTNGYGSFAVDVTAFKDSASYKIFLWSAECDMLPFSEVYTGELYD